MNEDAEQDESFREETRTFTNKLRKWLGEIKNNSLKDMKSFIDPVVGIDKYEGGLIFNAKWVDIKYKDLNILMMPQTKGTGSYQSLGGFGRSPDGAIAMIVINNLLEPYSLEHCDTRLNIKTFIHEFIHYLDAKREKITLGSGNSTSKLRAGDISGYYNNSGEFNAYFQEMASVLDSIFKSSAIRSHPIRLKEISSWEGFKSLAENTASTEWQALIDPKYRKKFLKRLYGLFSHLTKDI